MGEYLQFVSIDTWTMIFTLINFLVLFLLLKKFLFKPINNVLEKRADEIENTYKTAEKTKIEAEDLKIEYEGRLKSAKEEADGIIKSAVINAQRRSDDIVNEASEKAQYIVEKSQKQIELDKKNAVNEAQSDIASLAVDIAEKIIGKKLDSKEDEQLVSDIIDRI